MLTQFGKEIRKLRIDKGMSLKVMAQGVGVSSAYLSSVENGKKRITDDLINNISIFLNASDEIVDNLKDAAMNSIFEYKLNVEHESEQTKETVSMFARNFSSLSDKDMARIKKLLEEFE